MGKLKIILVDDKAVYRNAIKTLLLKLGDVEILAEASNGIEFIDIITKIKPDLVFMDIEMPEMNGIEATKRAIAIHPDITIIGLSMYENKKYIEDLLAAGARGYLLKLSDNAQIFRQIIKNPKAEVFYSKEIAPDTQKVPQEKASIVIADDFENTRFVIEFTLKQAGYDVFKASDGKDALRYFDGRKIDLLITDYNMPNLDGLGLSLEVRKIEKYKNIPILILTTEVNEEKKQKVKEAGVSGWIQKPFVIDKFLAIVKQTLIK